MTETINRLNDLDARRVANGGPCVLWERRAGFDLYVLVPVSGQGLPGARYLFDGQIMHRTGTYQSISGQPTEPETSLDTAGWFQIFPLDVGRLVGNRSYGGSVAQLLGPRLSATIRLPRSIKPDGLHAYRPPAQSVTKLMQRIKRHSTFFGVLGS